MLQTNNTATTISHKTNNLTVNNDGVTVGGLAFSYFIKAIGRKDTNVVDTLRS